MDARYSIRKAQLLAECQVAPAIFAQVLPRLHTFLAPFIATLQGQAPRSQAHTSVRGLLADVERQHVEAMASHCGQDRLGLQGFIGWDDGDETPLRHTLRAHVGQQWGQADGVLVCDPSAGPTSGWESVGVARQWGGRLGNVDHCQVALDGGDVSRTGHTLVDLRFSLPTAWTQEKARVDHAGVPKAHRGSRTRHQWALEMLAHNRTALPQSGLTGDAERGRPSWFRRRLATWGARSLVAVPSHTARRDLATAPPAPRGRGRRPQRPWHSVAPWGASRDEAPWRRIDVRAGAKGPLVVARVQRRVGGRTHRRQPGDEALLVVIRSHDRDKPPVVTVDASLSTAAPETPLGALARVANAGHRMEAGLQRSTREAGLADDEVRHWTGWHPHHTLSLLATWCLERETHRGKNMAPCDDVPADSPRDGGDRTGGVAVRDAVA